MSLVRAMKSAKKEVLRLLITFIDNSGPPEVEPKTIAQNFIPLVLDIIIVDYQRNVDSARDPDVLTLFTTVVNKLRSHVLDDVPRIMDGVFECTFQMITANFEDYPEHRIKFFELLQSINMHCFSALFNIPPKSQKLFVDSVVFAMKHTDVNIAVTGLEILHELLLNVGRAPNVAQGYVRSLTQIKFRDACIPSSPHVFRLPRHCWPTMFKTVSICENIHQARKHLQRAHSTIIIAVAPLAVCFTTH
eukprot:5630888-Ditylum_brightwellii.AAC.1